MRSGQHSKRPRGGRQSNGGRKTSHGPNRTYDSNGPDVKVRGTANHIYEKYQQLARDAQSAGDRVAAENYLQHAEHYYRLMLANNLVTPSRGNGQQNQQNGSGIPGQGAQPDMPPFDLSLASAGDDADENNDDFSAEAERLSS
ncbi:DUF4167 domain-containing protein [Zavarzinia compransoris]|uniref:DUF4167 domain-containing protein n=1 Tax=Zavarzinia marina TaxID=2911065 RepID=UPI001F43B56B|nr:DUF4167 domain-containing protein [Zavarzinia marina]MCF4167030.1 DUF4167 domain-containing protein [Zavarzinia marina]